MSTQSTRVGVVGLGYVGLPLALSMHNAGYEVVGVDVDPDTVERLRAGDSTVSDVSDSEVTDAVAEGLQFTTDYAELADVDGVSVCVPTPLRKTDTPDTLSTPGRPYSRAGRPQPAVRQRRRRTTGRACRSCRVESGRRPRRRRRRPTRRSRW